MSRILPPAGAERGLDWPGVSVIVAAHNAAATLRHCLDSLRALDYPDVQLIVVDDGSTDETGSIAGAAGARVLESSGRGPAAARNLGVAAAVHEIVAFTDADCVVPRHWLRSLVNGLRTSRAAGAGGPQRNVFPDAVGESGRDLDLFFSVASVIAEYTRGGGQARYVDHNASCNVAYIKHTIVEAGGFTEGLFPGEDVDLDHRLQQLGYRCYYVPEARVDHHRPGTRAWFAAMMRRYGRAQRALVEQHGRFRPLHYFPVGLAALAALQLLWIPRRTRSAIAAIDAAATAGVLGLLIQRVPPERWSAVLGYAVLAIVEWNRGYAEGLSGAAGSQGR
jgi:GT2 family glycosyltransferase